MNTCRYMVLATLAMLMLGCTGNVREREAQALDSYMEYAQPAVDQFRFWSLRDWELVGDYQLVVWPNRREAYLLMVDEPCSELRWARAIGISSTGHTVQRRLDTVNVGTQKCRIMEIRPIDYQKMRRDRRSAGQRDAAAQSSGGT